MQKENNNTIDIQYQGRAKINKKILQVQKVVPG